MNNEILCDYGCGQIAKHTFKNGKHCCESCSAKCPAVKKKTSESIRKNIDEWRANGENIRHHHNDAIKKKRKKQKIDNHGKCDNPGCTNFNDGTYGSGRFCSEHCAYAYAMNITKESEKRKLHYKKLIEDGKIAIKSQYGTWTCKICNKIFNTRNELKQHISNEHIHMNCQNTKNDKTKYICPFCGKQFEKQQSLGGHTINCKKHPNKNMYDDAHKRAGETNSLNYFNEYSKNGTIKIKARHSRYSRFKNIKDEEYLLQSSYELEVAKRLNEDGIYWENTTKLTYEIDGKLKKYRPDMTIPSLNCYIEVKGWFSPDDQKKMKCILKSNPNAKIYFIYDKDYKNFILRKIDLNDELIITYDNIDKWIQKANNKKKKHRFES